LVVDRYRTVPENRVPAAVAVLTWLRLAVTELLELVVPGQAAAEAPEAVLP
jgi:hypothetical protein